MDSTTTVFEYTAAMASSAPAPGGGGASALVGAVGASLGSMAANLTTGKKKYLAVEDDMRRIAARCEELRARLLELASADETAFLPLSKMYSIPKDTPGYAEAFLDASLKACEPAREMLKCCCEAIDLLDEAAEKCSRLMLSDVACGAANCRAALQGAALNIFVNTKNVR